MRYQKEKGVLQTMAAITAVITIASALAWSSNNDHDEQVQQLKNYTEQVCAGNWPPYKDIKINCTTLTEEAK